MPTIADNIHSMAALVETVKKTYHLSEATVLRIVDMNFGLAQAAGAASFSGAEEFPMPEGYDQPPEGFDPALMPFPMSEDEVEATKADDSDEVSENAPITTPTPPEGLN